MRGHTVVGPCWIRSSQSSWRLYANVIEWPKGVKVALRNIANWCLYDVGDMAKKPRCHPPSFSSAPARDTLRTIGKALAHCSVQLVFILVYPSRNGNASLVVQPDYANFRGHGFHGQARASLAQYSHPSSQFAAKACRNMCWPRPITIKKNCSLECASKS